MSEPGKTETRVDEWMRDAAHEIRSGYDVCEGFEPFITEIIAKHYLASHAPSASAETICSNCGRDVNDKMSAEQRAEIERLRAENVHLSLLSEHVDCYWADDDPDCSVESPETFASENNLKVGDTFKLLAAQYWPVEFKVKKTFTEDETDDDWEVEEIGEKRAEFPEYMEVKRRAESAEASVRKMREALDKTEAVIRSARKHFGDPATTRCQECTIALFAYDARMAALAAPDAPTTELSKRSNTMEITTDRKGKYNRGHRHGCPSDIPEGFYGYGCSCEWLDHIDKVKSESGFHWRDDVYFYRMRDQSVRLRIFGQHNGTPNYIDRVIPPNEWASIVSSVCRLGETNETFNGALLFHQSGTSVSVNPDAPPEKENGQ